MATVTSVGSGNYNTGSTWDSGARPGSSDDVVIANGHTVTLAQAENANSLKSESGSTIVGGGFTITIDGEGDGSSGTTNGYAVDLDGIISGELNLNITTADTTNLDIIPSSGNVHDLTINLGDAARIAKIQTGGPTLTGDLTITSGQLSTENNALTVTGHVLVEGTLTGGTSTITIGSLTINSGGTYNATSGTTTITSMTSTGSGDRSLNNKSGGTFTNNDGTVLFNSSSDQRMEMAGTGNVHNLTINKSDNDLVTFGNLTIEGDLSITTDTTHTMRPNNASETLTVTGDVTIVEGKLGELTNYTGAISFGSLTIESGGTYIATSGTTTITSETSGGFAMVDQGTFTHNNGTIQIGDGSTAVGSGTHTKVDTFYNLTVNMSASSVDAILRPNSGSTVTVANDLTVTQGEVYRNNASDTLTVTGDVDIAANGTLGRTK